MAAEDPTPKVVPITGGPSPLPQLDGLPAKPHRAKRARPPKTRAERIDEQRCRLHQVGGICGALRRVFADITEGHAPVVACAFADSCPNDIGRLASDAETALEAAIAMLEDIDRKLSEVRS
jgi:hypothetical protein